MTFQLALAVCVLCVTWPKVSSRKCENTKMRSNCCKHNGPIELALSSICIPCKQRDNIGSALQLDVKAINLSPPTILYITYLDLSQTVWSGLAISTANEFAFSTVSLWKIVTIGTHTIYIYANQICDTYLYLQTYLHLFFFPNFQHRLEQCALLSQGLYVGRRFLLVPNWRSLEWRR